MKLLLLILLSFPFNGVKYLSKVKGFEQNSYFKKQAYIDNKTLDAEPEANRLVNSDSFDLHLMNWCLFAATVEIREKENASPVRYYESLRNAATLHSNEMAERDFYEHINPFNAAIKLPADRLGVFNVKSAEIAENIYDFPFVSKHVSYKMLARKIIEGFYASAGHRKNLLDDKTNFLGCGAQLSKQISGQFHYLKVTMVFAFLHENSKVGIIFSAP